MKNMKSLKKMVTILLTGVFLLMLGVPVFAAPTILTVPVPVDTVKSIQVVDDTYVHAGGGIVSVDAYAPNGDTNFNIRRTYVGVYDALRTSDPGSGGNLQVGAIVPMPTFHSTTEVTVTIDTSKLTAGTYWLRFTTRLSGGEWEVAEGVLMVH
ncbi:MAG: hypothetical protein ACYDEJ_02300 [Desulfitobacteriaceae bacterium]